MVCIFEKIVLLLSVQFASTFPTCDPRLTIEGTLKVPIDFWLRNIVHSVVCLPANSNRYSRFGSEEHAQRTVVENIICVKF